MQSRHIRFLLNSVTGIAVRRLALPALDEKMIVSCHAPGYGRQMPFILSRREFAAALGTAGLGLFLPRTRAIEAFQREGAPRLRLSLAAYSFRDYFKHASHPREHAAPPEKQIDLFQFIDYAAAHGCQAVELTSYYFPDNPTEDFLLKVKRHAFLRGVDLSGTSVGNSFTHPAGEKREREISLVKKWIRHAALMGIPHIRVFAGGLEGQPLEVARRNCIEALEECLKPASEAGVFLGIENHGGIVAEADELLHIIHAVQSPWLGINLDTANFHTEDPYLDLERCAPYAVNVQLKTEIRARNRPKEQTDLQRVVRILRDANYQGYVVLEYEAAESPWEAVPGILRDLSTLLAEPS